MEQLLRFVLPTYLIIYCLAAFVWRSFVVRKRTGINPVTFSRSENAHDCVGNLFKLVFLMIAAVVLIYSFAPSLYTYATPIVWLERTWVKWIGLALLAISLAWTVTAQAQMGLSWRICIDEVHKTNLVETGVFRRSRNPIFSGMIVTLLGFFLTIPNAVTLLVLGVGFAVIQIQVRLEEEFLLRTHGEKYVDYQRRVRRWL